LDNTTDIDEANLALARSNPILGALSPNTIARLIESALPVEVAAHEELVRQGDGSDCAYLIVDGELEVQAHTAHGEVPLARVSAGALIGEIGVFANLPRNATVRTQTRVRALRFERAHLIAAGESDPALLRSVISRLGGQISRFNTAIGLYTNAVSALERDSFDVGILDELRQPSPELLDFAQHFRRMAEQIVQRRAHEAEMASAAVIQRAMLPTAQPANLAEGQFDIFSHMKPARDVGGDLYDIVELAGNRIVITIGDICGKGVPAALFMAVTQTVMRLAVRTAEDLKAEIETANNLLVANNRQDMFATLFCAVIDVTTGAMTYCNCGHNSPLVLRRGGSEFEALRACGPPLGIMDGMNYETRSLALAPGDLMFLYTDGVTEAEDPDLAQFGTERLEQVLRETRGQPAAAMVESVVERVASFAKGAPQSDDITCIAIMRNEE
jgi:phosphoserine phosphatase RsbU/P